MVDWANLRCSFAGLKHAQENFFSPRRASDACFLGDLKFKGGASMLAWAVVLLVVVLTIAYVFYNFFRIRKMGEGTAEMIEMAEII